MGLAVLSALTLAIPVCGEEVKQGFVFEEVLNQDKVVARPGDILKYTDSREGTWLHTSDGKVKVYRNQFTPLDPVFTPARAYIWLKEHPPQRSRDNPEPFGERFLLCQALTERFPNHELAENFQSMACDFYAQSQRIKTWGKTDWKDSIAVIDEYLAKYPNGPNADRLHFKRFRLANDPYEYEGSTRLILQQIERYQDYLVSHPNSEVADSVRSELARLYAMAYECFPESNEKERRWVRSKALKLYRQLAKSEDLETRQRARIALFNLEHNRRIYSGPNDW